MKKLLILVVTVICLAAAVSVTGLAVEYQLQKQNLIRLHVVADSDSEFDQEVKLQVRDAVLAFVNEQIDDCADAEAAKTYLQDHLGKLETVANEALHQAGSDDLAVVTLCQEEFPTREYDTFSLPSGVYTSLRVTIGEGSGKNWWCVVFPSFCFTAATDSFVDTAAGAGFSEPLRDTLAGEEEYTFGFFFLDCIGKLENFFHFG